MPPIDEELRRREQSLITEESAGIPKSLNDKTSISRAGVPPAPVITKPETNAEFIARERARADETSGLMLKGLGSGYATTGEAIGVGLRYIGKKTGSQQIEELGRLADTYWSEARQKWAPPTRLQKDVIQDPSLLIDPKWWSYHAPTIIGTAIPFMVPAAAGAAAGAKLGQGAANALKLTRFSRLGPKAAEWSTSLGASGVGAASNALFEGALAYKSAEEAGGSPEEAGRVARNVVIKNFAWTASTSFAGAFNPIVKKTLSRALLSAVTEGAQETGEEWISQSALHKARLGMAPKISGSAAVLGAVFGFAGTPVFQEMMERATPEGRKTISDLVRNKGEIMAETVDLMVQSGIPQDEAIARAESKLQGILLQGLEDHEDAADLIPQFDQEGQLAAKAAKEGQFKPIPERPETLNLQLDALKEGRVPAVMDPAGRIEAPEGMQKIDTPQGSFVFDPAKVSADQIQQSVEDGTFPKLLGFVEPAGMNTDRAVIARVNGIEAKSALVSAGQEQAQAEELKRQFPNAEIEITDLNGLNKVLAERKRASMNAPDIKVVRPETGKETKAPPGKAVPAKGADAVYIGDMTDPDTNEKIPFFNITKEGHPRKDSTVSLKALQEEGLTVPNYPGSKVEIKDKDSFRSQVKEAFKLSDEEADSVSQITDARAEAWAKSTGKDKSEWYKSRIASIERGGKPGDMAQSNAPAFYSKLEKTIEEKMPNAASADQVRAILKNAGVKQEEIDWLDVDGFLKENPKPTKQQLLDYVRSNQVEVNEVTKGEDSVKPLAYMDETIPGGKKQFVSNIGRREVVITELSSGKFRAYIGNVNLSELQGRDRPFDTIEEAKQAVQVEYEKTGRARGTKFQQYTLPGGENYREVLLTLPDKEPVPSDWTSKINKEETRNQGREYRDVIDPNGREVALLPAEDVAEYIRSSVSRKPERSNLFKGGHFDEPNVLAHVRLNDRTDADGKKVLFVEEIQSDWHQKGRKEGYVTRTREDRNGWKAIRTKDIDPESKLPDNTYSVYDEEGQFVNRIAAGSEKEAIENAQTRVSGHVPNAPFKKTWHELALKRILRMAAEEGYDRVAWTTGEQQADRYDLSTHFTEIKARKNINGYIIEGKGKDGRENLVRNEIQENKLPDVVGKELAKKIIEAKPNSAEGVTFSGLDLKVGGEGMKGFYDQMVPSFLNKYAKKWGAKVGETSMETKGGFKDLYVEQASDDAPFGVFDREDPHGAPLAEFDTESEALNWLTDEQLKQKIKVPSIDITPAMKSSVLGEGQPLFQGGEKAKASVEFLQDGRAIIRAFEKADVSSILHELGHIIRRDLGATDTKVIEQWAGVEGGKWETEAEEKFARAFEAYLREGNAPTPKLQGVFAKIKDWLRNIYESIKDLRVDMNDDVRQVFANLLTDSEVPTRDIKGVEGPGEFKQEGKKDEGKPKPRIVDQAFETKRFEVTPEQAEDLSRRLKALGLDERKVRSFEEVEAMAQVLGADPRKLIEETRNNRLTDAEVAALAKVIKANSDFIVKAEAEKLTNPDKAKALDERIQQAQAQLDAAIKKAVKSGTEAGRAVAAHRILAQNTMDPAFWLVRAQRILGDRKMTPEIHAAILDLINRSDLQGLANYMSMLRTPSFMEKVITFWKAGLLTSPTTHLANIGGNLSMAALNTASDVVAAPFDVLASLVTGQRTTTFSPATVWAKVKGLGKGVVAATKFMKNGVYTEQLANKWDMPRTVNFNNKILNAYTQTVFGLLQAEDIVFRQMAMSEALEKQAIVTAKNEGFKGDEYKGRVRELLTNPTNEMVMNAIEAAEYATFQDESALANALTSFKRSLDKPNADGSVPAGRQAAGAAAEIVMPFTKTPTNVGARIADFSPLGFVKAILNQVEPTTRGQKKMVEDVSRALTGTSVMTIGAFLGAAGLITGNAPENDREREDFYAEGKQPYSIYINGRWHQINRLAPVGMLLALGADLQQLAEEKENKVDVAIGGAFSGMKAIKEQSFLMGVSGLMKATEYPTSSEKFINRMAGSLVPAVIGRSAAMFNPTLRAPEGMAETIAARLPFLMDAVPPKRDIWGAPVGTGGGRLNLFDPFSSKPAKEDPRIQEAHRLGTAIGMPSNSIHNFKLNNREYSFYQKLQGRALKHNLTLLINHPAYERANDEEKKNNFEDVIRDTRRLIASQSLGPILQSRYKIPLDVKPELISQIAIELQAQDKEFLNKSDEDQAAIVEGHLKRLGKWPGN